MGLQDKTESDRPLLLAPPPPATVTVTVTVRGLRTAQVHAFCAARLLQKTFIVTRVRPTGGGLCLRLSGPAVCVSWAPGWWSCSCAVARVSTLSSWPWIQAQDMRAVQPKLIVAAPQRPASYRGMQQLSANECPARVCVACSKMRLVCHHSSGYPYPHQDPWILMGMSAPAGRTCTAHLLHLHARARTAAPALQPRAVHHR